MKCPSCNAEFSKPLETFLGEWHCPNCLKDMFPNETTTLVINAENHLKLRHSEDIFYQQWLTNVSNLSKTKKNSILQQAVQLCEQSAYLNNPYALVNLGYYYEYGYAGSQLSYNERLRYAQCYYKAVIFNANDNIALELGQGATALSQEKLHQLKTTAGLNLLCVLNKVAKDCERQILGTINKQELINRAMDILTKYGVEPAKQPAVEQTDWDINVNSVFHAICKPTVSAYQSLFGIYMLTHSQLAQLNGLRCVNNNGIKQNLGDYINRNNKLKLKIAIAQDDQNDRGFADIKNSNAIARILSDNKPDTMFFLYYYNYSNKSNRVSAKELASIGKCLESNCDSLISALIRCQLYNNFTFSEDDIVYYSDNGKLSYKSAIEKIINSIGGVQ